MMTNDLTLKATITLQANINHHMRNSIIEIKRRVENTIDWCKRNNKSVSKTTKDILEICDRELAYLDVQYVRLEELKTGIDKKQTKVERYGDVV